MNLSKLLLLQLQFHVDHREILEVFFSIGLSSPHKNIQELLCPINLLP